MTPQQYIVTRFPAPGRGTNSSFCRLMVLYSMKGGHSSLASAFCSRGPAVVVARLAGMLDATHADLLACLHPWGRQTSSSWQRLSLQTCLNPKQFLRIDSQHNAPSDTGRLATKGDAYLTLQFGEDEKERGLDALLKIATPILFLPWSTKKKPLPLQHHLPLMLRCFDARQRKQT